MQINGARDLDETHSREPDSHRPRPSCCSGRSYTLVIGGLDWSGRPRGATPSVIADSVDRFPEVDARLGRAHCVGDIQDRFHLKIGERSELGCRFG